VLDLFAFLHSMTLAAAEEQRKKENACGSGGTLAAAEGQRKKENACGSRAPLRGIRAPECKIACH